MQQIPTKKKSIASGVKIDKPKLHCGIQNGFEKMKELTKERINQHMLEKNHLTLEIVNLKIEMIEPTKK